MAHVAIEIACLPERLVTGDPFLSFSSLNRDFGLQQLHRGGKGRALRLAHKHVYVFGHDHVGVYAHLKAAPYLFQCQEKFVLHAHPRQQRLALKTAEGEEMTARNGEDARGRRAQETCQSRVD
jgi:hypothetical protein